MTDTHITGPWSRFQLRTFIPLFFALHEKTVDFRGYEFYTTTVAWRSPEM